jgi:hypothetical protein
MQTSEESPFKFIPTKGYDDDSSRSPSLGLKKLNKESTPLECGLYDELDNYAKEKKDKNRISRIREDIESFFSNGDIENTYYLCPYSKHTDCCYTEFPFGFEDKVATARHYDKKIIKLLFRLSVEIDIVKEKTFTKCLNTMINIIINDISLDVKIKLLENVQICIEKSNLTLIELKSDPNWNTEEEEDDSIIINDPSKSKHAEFVCIQAVFKKLQANVLVNIWPFLGTELKAVCVPVLSNFNSSQLRQINDNANNVKIEKLIDGCIKFWNIYDYFCKKVSKLYSCTESRISKLSDFSVLLYKLTLNCTRQTLNCTPAYKTKTSFRFFKGSQKYEKLRSQLATIQANILAEAFYLFWEVLTYKHDAMKHSSTKGEKDIAETIIKVKMFLQNNNNNSNKSEKDITETIIKFNMLLKKNNKNSNIGEKDITETIKEFNMLLKKNNKNSNVGEKDIAETIIKFNMFLQNNNNNSDEDYNLGQGSNLLTTAVKN